MLHRFLDLVLKLIRAQPMTISRALGDDVHEIIARDDMQIYMMGLVNKPMTSQGLELWEGMDPGWEKMLR